MLEKPFLLAKNILQQLEQAYYQAYFVGGSVRDLLLKRDIGDIDIATSASPKQVMELFDKVIPVGIEHGTVIVRYQHISYEVTTFRIDGAYSDQRHPDHVHFTNDITQDLNRRDFTINALAMDINGLIIDPFAGRKDIKDKVIRTVGSSKKRFKEDPLRMIRALRFSSQLGFRIERNTLKQIKILGKEIETVSVERLTNEIEKLFAGDFVLNGIFYLKKAEIEHHLPIIRDHLDLIDKLPKDMEPIYSFGQLIALFHYFEERVSIRDWCKSWKCSNQTKDEASILNTLIHYYEAYGIDNWLIYQLPEDYIKHFTKLIKWLFEVEIDPLKLIKIRKLLPIQSKSELVLNGHEIASLFPELQKGPWLKQMITNIEKKVVLCELKNQKYDLKEWIKWNPPEIN